jgi:predicted Zn-dependent protease
MKIEQRYIIFQATSDVPESLITATKVGLEKAISLVPKHLDRFRFAVPAPQLVAAADNLISRMRERKEGRQACLGLQLDASRLAEMVVSANDNRKECWPVFLCNDDLMHPKFGWVFGLTFRHLVSVQSVARFMNPRLTDSQKEMAVTRLLAHEVGHLLGLVERSHNTVDLYGKHCANVCIMRQAVTPLRWIKFAEEEKENGVDFCSCCKQELADLWIGDMKI